MRSRRPTSRRKWQLRFKQQHNYHPIFNTYYHNWINKISTTAFNETLRQSLYPAYVHMAWNRYLHIRTVMLFVFLHVTFIFSIRSEIINALDIQSPHYVCEQLNTCVNWKCSTCVSVPHTTGSVLRMIFLELRLLFADHLRHDWCRSCIVYSTCWMHLPNVQKTLRWRHNGCDSVSNHQPHDCLLNRLFRRRSKKTSKLRVTGLCVGNSPGTGEFPAQMAS